MKKLILVMLIILSGSIGSAQNMLPCGQGIIIRPNNSVTIDKWISWITPTALPISNQPNQGNLVSANSPSRIIIGESVMDNTPICVENADITKCISLDKIRTFIGK